MNKTSLLAQLTAVPLEQPCDAAWDEMAGDGRVRRCEQCSRDVLHLSAMSAREAEIRLLNSPDAVPCIRYARDDRGAVLHLAELPQRPLMFLRARSALAATTLSAGLTASVAFAGEDAPDQCVAYEQPASNGQALAKAEASPSIDDAKDAKVSAKPAKPIAAAKPSASREYGVASAEAPRSVQSPPPGSSPAVAPPEPRELGGKPAMPHQQPDFGTLVLKSSVNRGVKLIGIALAAPLSRYKLTPGDFTAQITEPNGKVRKVKFTIQKGKDTVVDLDAK